jgi:hypothetical protein
MVLLSMNPAMVMFGKRPVAFEHMLGNIKRMDKGASDILRKTYQGVDIPGDPNAVTANFLRRYDELLSPKWGHYGMENEARAIENYLNIPDLRSKIPSNIGLNEESMGYFSPENLRSWGWNPSFQWPMEFVHKRPLQGLDEILHFLEKEAPGLDLISRGGKYGGGLHISQSFPEMIHGSREFAPEKILPPLLREYSLLEPAIFPPRAAYKPNPRGAVNPFANWLKENEHWFGEIFSPQEKGVDFLRLLGARGPGKFESGMNFAKLTNPLVPGARIEYRPFSSSEFLNPELGENIALLQNILDVARRDPKVLPKENPLKYIYEKGVRGRKGKILKQQKEYHPEGMKKKWSPYGSELLEEDWYKALKPEKEIPSDTIRRPRIDYRTIEDFPEDLGLPDYPERIGDMSPLQRRRFGWYMSHHPESLSPLPEGATNITPENVFDELLMRSGRGNESIARGDMHVLLDRIQQASDEGRGLFRSQGDDVWGTRDRLRMMQEGETARSILESAGYNPFSTADIITFLKGIPNAIGRR